MKKEDLRKTYTVIVRPQDKTMLFLDENNPKLNDMYLKMFKMTMGISNHKIFEIYEDLEIKEILYLRENPITVKRKIKGKEMDFPVSVSVGSVEDENPQLLHQLSRLVID